MLIGLSGKLALLHGLPLLRCQLHAGAQLKARYNLHMQKLQLSGIIQFLPLGTFYPMMAAIALALGGGLGFFVSFFTIRKELRV